MATATLPAPLHDKLRLVAARIRLQRAAVGASRLVLILALGAGTVFLLDSWLDLPTWAREVALVAWVAVGLTTLVGRLLMPLCRRLDDQSMAALIEERYPDLAERLTSTVELAGDRDRFHGSPVFIESLVRETERRAEPLDFRRAVPGRHTGRLAAFAGLALALVFAPAGLWPGRYKELGERFLFPWREPVAVPVFAFQVTPGDTFVARGQPVTLSVVIAPQGDSPLPRFCTLIAEAMDGSAASYRMTADRTDAFSVRLDKDQVARDFRYHIRAGEARSDSYLVSVIEPVELAEGSPVITARPPEYAQATVEAQSYSGVTDLTVLQHSRVAFECSFRRPAVAASLVWTVEGADRSAASLPLELSADRMSGHVTIPAASNAAYKLVFEAEHGIRTELPARMVHIRPDQPPAFERVAGSNELKVILPYQPIPVEMSLADDVGVETAEVLISINQAAPFAESVKLEGKGTRDATARGTFSLAGKVQEGDEVRYRFKITDNRRVPEAKLEPNVSFFPEQGWRYLKIARQAEPLAKQEIMAQRDAINKKLEAIKADLKQEKRGVYKLEKDTHNQSRLTGDQAKDLQTLGKDNRASEDALRDLAAEAQQTPALQPLADKTQDVADKEMRQTAEALRSAAKDSKPAARELNLDKAEKELENALSKLDDLQKSNDRLAQDRLDQMKLELAAEQQRKLADKAADAKDPGKTEQVKQEQADIAKQVKDLADNSPALRDAVAAAQAEKARQDADKAKELAQAERDLDKAVKDTEKQKLAGKLDDLAKKQQELTDKADKLGKETRPAVEKVQAKAFQPEAADKATQALKREDAGEAMENQDKSSKDLDKLAKDLQRAADLDRDPKEAARQLAKQEGELARKVDDAKGKPEQMKDLEKAQNAIAQAAKSLSVPVDHNPAKQEKQTATQKAAEAAEALNKNDPNKAKEKLEQAKQALERLAERLPSLEERKNRALADVARLKEQQSEIAKQAEKAAKPFEKSDPEAAKTRSMLGKELSEAARKQADLAEQLSKVDAPMQEARQEKAQEKANKALADLMDARPKDIAKSQQESKDQLAKLERALKGEKADADPKSEPETGANESADKSPREQTKELAKLQRELAQTTDQAQKKDAKIPGEAGRQALQRDLARSDAEQAKLNEKASKLPANQNQKALEQAREAMNAADRSLARGDAGQAVQRQKDAADALDRLASQLPDTKPESPTTKPKGTAEAEAADKQADQARQLAKEQRDLKDAVQKMVGEAAKVDKPPQGNPAGELAKKQEAIAKEAGELAKQVGQEQGAKSEPTQTAQSAAQSARQAANQMQAGAGKPAQSPAQQAAQDLRRLAKQLGDTPAPKGDANAPDTAQQARDLARKQEELNKLSQAVAGDTNAQQTQQKARQEDLKQQTGELSQELQELAKQMGRSPQAQQGAQQAASAAQQAQGQMQNAQQQGQQGQTAQAGQSRQEAARNLEQAAQQSTQAAQAAQPAGAQTAQGQQPGQSLQQAQGQMSQAQAQLGKGNPQQAQGSMQQAAQSLQQAAQQLAQMGQQQGKNPGRPGSKEPGEKGVAPGGTVDASLLPDDQKKYAGKRWGDLPGELRTQIIQDAKAKYGENHARRIKLYFEQVADTNKK